MSGNVTEENNLFDDYFKTDNLDDSELQARLYAEIYYESNIESESRTMDAPRTIKFDDMVNETNVESGEMQHELEKQLSVSETDRDSQKTHSIDQTEFIEANTLTDIQVNPAQGCDDKNLEDPSVMQGKENTENSSKKSISSKHTQNTHKEKTHNDTAFSKYNVVSKCVKQKRLLAKQTDEDKDSSDSEESIFEVPVPPKPNPPLIDLQDSDEENDSNSGVDKDDLILKKWENNASVKTYSRMTPFRNCELEILYNKNTVNPGLQTSTQKVPEDIVLNCTTIQRGAKSISEIKQLSSRVNQENKFTKDTNQNSKKIPPQNKSKRNNENANLQQETSVTSERKLQMIQHKVNKYHTYNLRSMKQNKTSEISMYINRKLIPITDQQKRYNDEVDSQPKMKRQCTIQQNNQDVMLQGNNDKEKRNLSNEFFEPMSEEMRNYYNSTHGQENFDVRELQQGMSKDPQMWAILDEDIMPCPRQPFRFWNIKCSNCHQNGHRRYDCPTLCKPPCCYMCGMKGHTESRCPQKMCLTCGKRQNTFRNTCEHCRVLYCTMCNSVGHKQDQCPDLWRRYHQTTDMSSAPQDPGNVMKPSKLLYCCNCAKRGHESSTCKEYRWSEHFPSPAVVTNYTDGPIYVPSNPQASSFSEPEVLSGAREIETSIPQSYVIDIRAMTEDEKYFANIDISNIDFDFSQEAVGISEMDGNLKSSFMASNIWPIVKTNLKQTKVTNVTFIRIIYSYGVFHNKNHKDARMILKNLTTFFLNRKSMYNNLINCEVAPVFLKTLFEKTKIKFEVKIGFTAHRTLSLQLSAMKEYIEFLYDLLKYWLNLPDDEKDYGIDVTLPTNPIKIFNLLNSRVPQLDKMHFTCYDEHIGGINDPRWIYNYINHEKAKLKQYKGNHYKRLRRNLWRYQIKLLMIVNTEPSPNIFVRTFRDVMKKFQSERHLMGEKLDIVTYLKLILLYNHLFVPHTSEIMINETLNRINIEEKKKTNLLQIQQKPETAVHEQENVCNVYSSSVVSSPQNTPESCSRINNQQNNEMLIEQQNKNNTLFETNKTMDRNCDERKIIKESLTQDPQIIPLNNELVSVQSESPKRKEDQLSNKIEAKIESNVSMNKQHINVNDTVHTIYLSTKESRRRAKEERKRRQAYNKLFGKNSKHIYDTASNLIKWAHSFKLPHMMKAADKVQKQVDSKTIRPKHIKVLSKLIRIEKAHQKRVNTYCETFK